MAIGEDGENLFSPKERIFSTGPPVDRRIIAFEDNYDCEFQGVPSSSLPWAPNGTRRYEPNSNHLRTFVWQYQNRALQVGDSRAWEKISRHFSQNEAMAQTFALISQTFPNLFEGAYRLAGVALDSLPTADVFCGWPTFLAFALGTKVSGVDFWTNEGRNGFLTNDNKKRQATNGISIEYKGGTISFAPDLNAQEKIAAYRALIELAWSSRTGHALSPLSRKLPLAEMLDLYQEFYEKADLSMDEIMPNFPSQRWEFDEVDQIFLSLIEAKKHNFHPSYLFLAFKAALQTAPWLYEFWGDEIQEVLKTFYQQTKQNLYANPVLAEKLRQGDPVKAFNQWLFGDGGADDILQLRSHPISPRDLQQTRLDFERFVASCYGLEWTDHEEPEETKPNLPEKITPPKLSLLETLDQSHPPEKLETLKSLEEAGAGEIADPASIVHLLELMVSGEIDASKTDLALLLGRSAEIKLLWEKITTGEIKNADLPAKLQEILQAPFDPRILSESAKAMLFFGILYGAIPTREVISAVLETADVLTLLEQRMFETQALAFGDGERKKNFWAFLEQSQNPSSKDSESHLRHKDPIEFFRRKLSQLGKPNFSDPKQRDQFMALAREAFTAIVDYLKNLHRYDLASHHPFLGEHPFLNTGQKPAWQCHLQAFRTIQTLSTMFPPELITEVIEELDPDKSLAKTAFNHNLTLLSLPGLDYVFLLDMIRGTFWVLPQDLITAKTRPQLSQAKVLDINDLDFSLFGPPKRVIALLAKYGLTSAHPTAVAEVMRLNPALDPYRHELDPFNFPSDLIINPDGFSLTDIINTALAFPRVPENDDLFFGNEKAGREITLTWFFALQKIIQEETFVNLSLGQRQDAYFLSLYLAKVLGIRLDDQRTFYQGFAQNLTTLFCGCFEKEAEIDQFLDRWNEYFESKPTIFDKKQIRKAVLDLLQKSAEKKAAMLTAAKKQVVSKSYQHKTIEQNFSAKHNEEIDAAHQTVTRLELPVRQQLATARSSAQAQLGATTLQAATNRRWSLLTTEARQKLIAVVNSLPDAQRREITAQLVSFSQMATTVKDEDLPPQLQGEKLAQEIESALAQFPNLLE